MGEQLILHEGLKLHRYKDTKGFWTLGVGFNLDARGKIEFERLIGRALNLTCDITRVEALRVLNHDIQKYEGEVLRLWPAYVFLDEVRQRVCLDMAFNMGYGAMKFKNTMKYIVKRDWPKAAYNMWQSKWADDVGDGPGLKRDRADRLTEMMLTGQDYVS
jgi:lysozyme